MYVSPELNRLTRFSVFFAEQDQLFKRSRPVANKVDIIGTSAIIMKYTSNCAVLGSVAGQDAKMVLERTELPILISGQQPWP